MMQQAISINLIANHHFYYLYYSKKESGTEIGNSLEFDFVMELLRSSLTSVLT